MKFTAFLILILIVCVAGGTSGIDTAFAAAPPAVDPLDTLQGVFGDTDLTNYAGQPHESSSVEPGADIITTVLFRLVDLAKYFLAGLAVLYIMLAGVQLITAGADIEDVSQKQKNAIKFVLYGLLIVIVADQFIQQVFFGDYGECLSSASTAQGCATAGADQIRGIYNFIEFLLGSIAVMMLVLAGVRMITSAGEEDVLEENKRRVYMAILGLMIVGIAEFFVKDFLFPAGGSQVFVVSQGQALVAMVTNFISSFIATVSIVMFIYAGYQYIFAIGNPEGTESAKKTMMGAVIGILIAAAAYGVVQTVSRIQSQSVDVPGGAATEVIEDAIDLSGGLRGQR